MVHRGHFPNEQSALKTLYLVTRSLDPKASGIGGGLPLEKVLHSERIDVTGSGSDDVATLPDESRPTGPDIRPTGPDIVVGIGSSAGGLEALQDLVGALGTGGRAAFVVAQHLSPEHRSLLVELLGRETGLSVVGAVDGAALEPGVIFVGPPNHDVLVRANVLEVIAPGSPIGPSPSIDVLLGSIAEQWGARGAGVVLSGTGSDGAHGLRALKAAGGLTFAQSPESAKFDAMPRAAIALGGVDLVLGAHEIGTRLAGLDGSDADWSGEALPTAPGPVLRRIVTQLQRATGIDFSRYKESTLRRQVNRRMALRQVDDAEDYLPLLVADPDEARALYQNILVTVTSFFRDPDAFDALGTILQEYVQDRASEDQLRVWVPGCATGEEVYSIGMLLDEALGHPVGLSARVKIFGTDLDETSLAVARRGLYPLSACELVTPDRRARYLVEGPNGAEVCQDLRDCTVFARHNVGEDPPFPRLDLVSCRNTLIYFTTPLQERVAELLSYALLPGGLLFLGTSELVPASSTGFATLDGPHRIYVRGAGAATPFTPGRTRPPPERRPTPVLAPIMVVRDTIPEQHVGLLEALVRSLAAPCLVMDESRDLVEVVGDVSPFCRVPEGRASAAAISILHPDLQAEARGLLLMTRADGEPLTGQLIDLPTAGVRVRMQARPLQAGDRSLTVLSFLAQETTPDSEPPGTERDAAYDREIERLDRELRDSQESMRRSLAELETANEELQASAEELQASSEELQSSYEELETSNEELQATNEELSSLNQQSRLRGDELEMLNTDLENIQASLSQGMILVDRDLRVTRFSSLAVRVFALVAGDMGQPLLEVPTTLPIPGLDQALHAVVGGGERRSLEITGPEVSYLAQVLPYQAPDGRRLGAIITLTDVTELVRLRQAMQAALTEFAQVTDALDEVVWKRDTTMTKLVYLSGGVQEMTGWTSAELIADVDALDNCIADEDRDFVLAGRSLDKGHWSLTYRLDGRDGTRRWIRETASAVHDDDGDFVVGTMVDITTQHEAESEAALKAATFKAAFDTTLFAVAILDRETRVTVVNQAFCDLLGYEPATVINMPLRAFAHPDELERPPRHADLLSPGLEGEQASVRHLIRSDGTSRWAMLESRPLPVAADDAATIVVVQDISERMAAEVAEAASEALLRVVLDNAGLGIVRLDRRLLLDYANQQMVDWLGRSSAELLGRSLTELGHPLADAPNWLSSAGLVLATAKPETFEYVIQDGPRQGSYEANLLPQVGPDGSVTHLIVTNRDVTEQKQFEARLEASRAQLLQAQRAAHVGSWTLDLASNHVTWSEELFLMQGLDPLEPPPDYTAHSALFTPESWERLSKELSRTQESGVPYELELEMVRPDGTHGWMLARGEVVRDAAGVVVGLQGVAADITESKIASQELLRLATHDPLTGLANRSMMLDDIKRAISAGRRSGGSTAVLMADLDHFKNVNDTLGHRTGDALLVAAAVRIKSIVRAGDLVARLGGDEFVVVMRELETANEAVRTAQRLVDAFRNPFSLNESEMFATASIGVAIAGTGAVAEDLVREADTAMYAAKSEGRDRVSVFNDDLRTAVTARLSIETGLRQAMKRGQLEVWYQPEVDLATGSITAVEALLRWRHPDGEVWTADRFIDVAEETGLIIDIGAWVLNQACAQGASWATALPDRTLTVRVNAAAVQLADIGMLPSLDEALAASGLDPALLCIEITESTLLRETATSSNNLRGIHQRGIALAIDDFGTGYASLTYLNTYPVDVLKIDRTFVADIAAPEHDDRLVAGIIALAQSLGICVTAEGVEQPEQAAHLRAMGCPSAQGWLYSKAVPADEIAPLLDHIYPH
ncbi:MAG: two-component system, chemotaxis family, CheB/CheR fusion protein [Actinomycetota bacterium]|nr:two-component system, chemotaxis family, CheB/CheR fusion protein [Actinomycetota bacterium]